MNATIAASKKAAVVELLIKLQREMAESEEEELE